MCGRRLKFNRPTRDCRRGRALPHAALIPLDRSLRRALSHGVDPSQPSHRHKLLASGCSILPIGAVPTCGLILSSTAPRSSALHSSLTTATLLSHKRHTNATPVRLALSHTTKAPASLTQARPRFSHIASPETPDPARRRRSVCLSVQPVVCCCSLLVHVKGFSVSVFHTLRSVVLRPFSQSVLSCLSRTSQLYTLQISRSLRNSPSG